MADGLNPEQTANSSTIYEIRLEGHLDRRWAGWLDGFSITLEQNGETVISGPVTDQSALHGLLRRVRDLGMTLISVNRKAIDKGETNEYSND